MEIIMYNDTDIAKDSADEIRGETVVSLFRKAAKLYSANNAVAYADKTLTYAEFDELTDNLAAKLVSLFTEIDKQPVVGILTGRSEFMPLSQMGAAKSGACYLPLDPSYPGERLAFMMKDSGAKFLIADRDLLPKVKDFTEENHIEIISTDEISGLPKADSEILSHSPKPEDLITIIYTSGTTGQPKGTLIHHAGVLNFVNWYRKTAGIIKGDNTVAYFSCGFIAHTMDIYAPLISGACMNVIPTEMRLNMPALKEFYETHNIKKAALTAQIARQFITNYAPKTLNTLIIGSEAIIPFDLPEGLKLVNMYGMTETSLASVSYTFYDFSRNIPIGKPIDNTKVYILDEEGNLAPQGEIGELAVAGIQVAYGYINRDELTAERFIKNPFSDDPHYARMYKTGDLVRQLPDGNIEYVGRSDFQVKISGFRVELPEIERRIREFPEVTGAAAIGADAPSGGKRILAYFTAEKNVDINELSVHLSEKLPPYMVPFASLQIDKMPLNQNGKLDRKALPKIEIKEEAAVSPRNETERFIAGVFEKIMGYAKIGVTSDLVRLGLSSLAGINAAAQLSDKFGVEISAPQIMRLRTTSEIAKQITSEFTSETEDAKSEEISYPLTKNQLGIYFACAADPDDLIYNNPAEIKFSAAVSLEKLYESAEAVINAHSYYKTRIAETGGVTRQIKAFDMPVAVSKTSCTETEYAGVKEKFIRPFSLTDGDLYRIEIYKTETAVYMLCDFHHIIFDGSSMAIFIKDLAVAYSGKELQPESYTAFDVAASEIDLENSAKYKKAKAYYKNLIGDMEGASTLPFQNNDSISGVGTETAEINSAEIDGGILACGVTAACLFLAATAVSVSRFAPDSILDDNSLRIVSISSGREGSKIANTVGMFVKTLPTVIDVSAEQTLSDFLSGVSDRMFGAIEHQAYNYMTASSEFDYTAALGFAYQGGLIDEHYFEGEACILTQAPSKKAKFPITITVNKEAECYTVSLEYDKALFEPFFIRNLADSIVYTAKNLGANTNRKVFDLSVITPEQKRQILEDFAGEKTDEVRGKTIVSLFRKAAKNYGENTAVVYKDKSLSYAQFDELTDNLAAKLISLFGENDKQPIVGILVDRSEIMPLSMMGVMKSGAAYLPLDPSYPADRLEYMLTDSGAKLLIADRDLAAKINIGDATLIFTDEIYSLPKANSAIVNYAPKPSDLITLIYTSGTTGKPKGTQVHQSGVVNFVNHYRKICNITPRDNVSAYIACGFDPHMQDFYPTLISGACLYVIPESMRLALGEMKDYFEENNITISAMPMQVGRQFMMNFLPKSLKVFTMGGEALTPFEPFDGLKVLNLYGPTETSVAVTSFTVDKLYKKIPIGKAFDNTALYVLDKYGHLVPPGVAGELVISGVQVTKGYLGRDDLTSEKFVKNPFSDDPDYAVMYKTGDLARFLSDGNIDFLGRNDFQVKIRGFRVELSEIERRIREFDGIEDAVVIAADARGGGKQILSYIVSDKAVDIAALNAFIEEKLPSYMVPAGTLQIEKIPLNQNGKINRKALPEITVNEAKQTPPANELERLLSDVIEEITGNTIGVLTSLAGAGFDSLSAIRAAMQISEKTGVDVSAPRIMKAKTIRKLSEFIAEKSTPETETAPEITAKTEKTAEDEKPREYAPLTQNQLGIYFACSQNPGRVTYNIPYEIKFSAAVNIAKLTESVKAVLNAHPYIKTRLEELTGEPRQYVLYSEIAEVMCRECREAEYALHKENFVKPFELLGGRLYRLAVFKTEKSVYMLCDFHHIIFDGASVGIFISDIAKAYSGETIDSEKHSAFEIALSESNLQNSEKYKDAKAYFYNLVGDGEGASQISDEKISGRSGALIVTAKVSRKDIDKALREYDVTAANFILSAAALTLSLYIPSSLISEKSLRIATVSSGREGLKYQNSFGMFVKTLPTAVDINPEAGAARFISDVSDRMFETIENQIYPYMQASSDFGYNAQIIFAYQGGLFRDITFEGEPITSTLFELSDPKFPLTITADRDDTDYIITLEYDRSCFEDFYAHNLAESIAFVAQELAADKDRKIREISAATPKQRRQILRDYAGIKTDDVKNSTIVDIFRETAAKLPEKTAVIYGETSLTYGELDKETDRIAAYLSVQNSGKKPIGILVERSENIPIMALAALKSGAPYMPLDPGYPVERLRFMLSDSGAEILIADRGLERLENNENGELRFPEFDGKTLYTDDLRLDETGKGLALPESPKPDDDFILLYTSGTTGNPKGAVLLHKGVMNYIDGYKKICKITENDRITAYASFGFDADMMDLYSALTSGACLYILPEEMRLDLQAISDYFKENEITVAFLTTQMGRQLIESGNTGNLRVMGVGGEALVPIVPPTGLTLYNLYGPTETTVAVTYQKVDRQFRRVPIGRTIQNTANYILDKNGNLAPAGGIGELTIAGRQVSKGYLNRPDLTAAKFVKNPFSDDPDYAVMYKTGDLARFLSDGSIDFLGRNDFQVKIRGFRVELTEIDARIREYPTIKDVAVIAADAPSGGKRILAYIVSDETVDIAALNGFIEDKLPYYMVPAGTKQIARIPLNRNGKVNRNELPEISSSENAKDIVLPKTETERLIVDIAAEIIGEQGISTDANLIQSGLDSLSAIRFAAKISQKLGIGISAPQIMKEKTIQKIAAFLDDSKPAEKQISTDKLSNKSYPLTANQLGIYFACVKDPGSLSYNIPCELVFAKNIDTDKLKQSTEAVINAHSYIKTRLTLENTEPRQLRLDDNSSDVSLIKCSEPEFAEIKRKFVKPFGLFDDNLYRITIVETEKSVYMLADFHHIIFDGGSLEIFMSELSRSYDGTLPQNEEFTSFDNALAEENNSAAYEKSKEYFDGILKTLESTSALPEQKSGEKGEAVTVSVKVNRLTIDKTIKSRGITAANHFLAAAALTVSRFAETTEKLSGETEGLRVAIASINSGRDDVRLQRNFGMIVQTLPTIIDIAAGVNAESFTAAVQDRMLETLENRFYPYMRVASDYGYNPQIIYAYQGGVITEHTLDGQPFTVRPFAGNAIKFPVNIYITADAENYEVAVEYDDSKFTMPFIKTFTEGIAATAVKLANKAEMPIREITVASESQLKIAEGFGRRFEKNVPSTFASLAEMFGAAVLKNPSKTALIADGESYSFAELDEASDKIANALIKRGINKGDRVAFKLSRTAAIPITILGIIKTGACYIPVDPEYPEERISHIVIDSGAKCLITADVYSELMKDGGLGKPNVPIGPSDPCYIIYTSGSTGLPKGVVIPNGGIVNYCLDVPENRHVRALTEADAKMVSVTTVSFDMFLKEAFTTLMNGLSLILANDEEAKDPKKLAGLFAKSGGNAFNATPSRLMQYLEVSEFAEVIKNCKVVMAGGEKYPSALYRRLRALTGAVLINTYGPTETTVSCNAKILDNEKITVGAPLYGVVEMVADIYGNPLPLGVIGELYIGGAGLALHYFGNPKLTQAAFEFVNGERFYKSGDLARFTDAGEIEILGRNDGQIKLRGLRIEPGEIENQVSATPGIISVAVLVKKIRGNEHLAAYYTAAREIPPEEIRDTLSLSLTKYMVPTAYLQMERFPVTPNGKTDIKALPEPELLRSEDYEPPANETERDFCDIFAALLKLERVGANDSFFDIGGTSLTVTQLTIETMKKGYEIGYGDVFANPSPRLLAETFGKIDTSETPQIDKQKINTYPTTENISTGDDGFDYTAINNLLRENTVESFTGGKQRELGNICLTGATGFLGIHVLYEFLKSEKGAAYVIVRGGKSSSEKRLKSLLVYYFSNSFDELFGSRIVVIEGDVTSPEAFLKLKTLPIDTLINCAANVKHFSAGTDIEDVNIGGVKCAVDYCLEAGVRLIHISTASVAGMSIDGHPSPDTVLNEQMLWFGQDISNKYVRSKFAAERLVLNACAKNGLDGKIMRVGNLMARASDGEFQANFNTNSFLGRLKAYRVIGSVPYSAMRREAEFAPIDCTADAILRLAKTPNKCRVFHPYNDHEIYIGDAIKSLNSLGIKIMPVDSSEYNAAFSAAMADPEKAKNLSSLIAYGVRGKEITVLNSENEYTSEILLRCGFLWPITGTDYLNKFFKGIIDLGYFDRRKERRDNV
jgi:amino acid adenylation domain-containing protein